MWRAWSIGLASLRRARLAEVWLCLFLRVWGLKAVVSVRNGSVGGLLVWMDVGVVCGMGLRRGEVQYL